MVRGDDLRRTGPGSASAASGSSRASSSAISPEGIGRRHVLVVPGTQLVDTNEGGTPKS